MTVTGPYLDDSATYGPTFSSPTTTTAPFLDGGVGFGAGVIGTTGLQVYVDGSVVSTSFDRSFRDQLADTGSFSFSVLEDDFTGIDFDDIVKFRVNGVDRFQGVVEQIDRVKLAAGEGADRVATVSGRGAMALLDQAVVYPSRGVGSVPIEDVRTFSWVSPDFVDTAWPLAKQVNLQRDYASWRAPLPWIWPDTTAYWIWGNLPTVNANSAPVGVCLFRKTFNLASAERVRIFCAFDNSGTLYVDGAEMTAFSSFATGRYVELEMSAGDHTIAARVQNFSNAAPPNPGGFIAAIYTVGTAALLGTLVTNTDGTWSCLPYPATAPGYTHGQVIRLLLEEAGLSSTISRDFSDEFDSGGEPWSAYREIAVQVGRSLLDVLLEMSSTYIDVAMAPGALTLRTWNRGDRGETRSVTLQQTADPATSDFLALDHSGRRTRLNTALIRYAGGTTEEIDAASVTAYGTKGAYLELGDIPGVAEAERVAAKLIESRALPAYQTTAQLHPRSAASTPYLAFEVGDTITCPDETGSNASMRVTSITLAEDGDGIIDWPVEMRDQQFETEERTNIWLRRMANGALFGGARVSSPAGTPDPVSQEVAALRVAEFSYDNSALAASLSPRRPAEASGNMVEIYGELTTAGSTSTVVTVLLNDATLGTLTFAAGETEKDSPLSIVPIRANIDKLQAQIVTAGTGAAGLDVQVRAI